MHHRLGRLILACLTILSLAHCSDRVADRSPARSPILLAIFAHPDDEASVGPVLAKYAVAGVQVHLAVATDGRLGVAAHSGIPAGDALAASRGQELQCAAERLGLQQAIQFGLQDQLKMSEGLQAYGEQVHELRERVRRLFEELQPDAVITWPASGWTGHPDHRIVSAVVTEVFQSQRWERPARLYYPAVPVGQLPPSHPLSAAAMDPRFLGVEIAISQRDYDKAKQAWLCHQSQYTPEMIEQLHQSMVATQKGIAHFYVLQPATDKSVSLLPAAGD